MSTATRKWGPIVGGLLALLVMAGLAAAGLSYYWLRDHMTVARNLPAASADAAFAAAARVFQNPRPAFEIGEDQRLRPAPGSPRRNAGTVATLHVLAWDARRHALTDVTLPMWMVRLKSGPIEFGGYASGIADHGVRLTAEAIDQLGPGILLDYHAPNGNHVLLSAQ